MEERRTITDEFVNNAIAAAVASATATAVLNQKLDDFITRYEKDSALDAGYRLESMSILKSHERFISKVEPVYSKGLIAIGAFILGIIGLLSVSVYHHIRWG